MIENKLLTMQLAHVIMYIVNNKQDTHNFTGGFTMTIIYDFYNNRMDGNLYLEIWQETPEWTEYLWSVPISSIAHGFSVLEKYKEGGYIVKQG